MVIERTWLDANGDPVLNLFRVNPQETLMVKEESLPELTPAGSIEEVPGTGLYVYSGNDAVRAGVYGVTLGTYGQRHADAWALQREVVAAAIQTRYIWRSPGEVLPVASFLRVQRTFGSGAMTSGTVRAEFQAASPYWWGREVRADLPSGSPVTLDVGGQANAPLRLELLAGAQPGGDVTVQSSAGLTVWRGTIPAGHTLTLDGTPGRWAVTLSGASGVTDVSRFLSGPQQYLTPGAPALTVTAGVQQITAIWQEGYL